MKAFLARIDGDESTAFEGQLPFRTPHFLLRFLHQAEHIHTALPFGLVLQAFLIFPLSCQAVGLAVLSWLWARLRYPPIPARLYLSR
jgi:hypothetical protein